MIGYEVSYTNSWFLILSFPFLVLSLLMRKVGEIYLTQTCQRLYFPILHNWQTKIESYRNLQSSLLFCIAQRDSLVKAKVPGKLYSAPFPWGEARKVPLQSFNFTLLLKTWWIMQYELELGRNLLSLTVSMHMRCWDIKLVSWDIFSRSTNTKAHGFL